MKYIKTYENLNIEVGDYVIIQPKSKYGSYSPPFKKLIQNNIGKISNINFNIIDVYYKDFKFQKKYDFRIDEILHHSKNKEDLEVILNTDKFNL